MDPKGQPPVAQAVPAYQAGTAMPTAQPVMAAPVAQQAYMAQPAQAYVAQQQVPVMMQQQQQQTTMVQRQIIGYKMKDEAWIWVIVLLFVCWPLAWLPCVCEDCKEPIYANAVVTQNTGVYQQQPATVTVVR